MPRSEGLDHAEMAFTGFVVASDGIDMRAGYYCGESNLSIESLRNWTS